MAWTCKQAEWFTKTYIWLRASWMRNEYLRGEKCLLESCDSVCQLGSQLGAEVLVTQPSLALPWPVHRASSQWRTRLHGRPQVRQPRAWETPEPDSPSDKRLAAAESTCAQTPHPAAFRLSGWDGNPEPSVCGRLAACVWEENTSNYSTCFYIFIDP